MNSTLALPTPRVHLRRLRRYHAHVPATQRDAVLPTLDAGFAAGTVGIREAYEAHGSLVYSICRRSLDADAAHDVTQEVFVSAWRGRQQFDPAKGNLAAWLVGITKRRIIDHVRSERRHADRRADESAAAADTDDTIVERVADRMLVADGLRQLPRPTRELVELAFIHDLTHQQIAEKTGTPLGTVKSNIRRGLLRIKEHMESTHA